jgi:hypothetical protein
MNIPKILFHPMIQLRMLEELDDERSCESHSDDDLDANDDHAANTNRDATVHTDRDAKIKKEKKLEKESEYPPTVSDPGVFSHDANEPTESKN